MNFELREVLGSQICFNHDYNLGYIYGLSYLSQRDRERFAASYGTRNGLREATGPEMVYGKLRKRFPGTVSVNGLWERCPGTVYGKGFRKWFMGMVSGNGFREAMGTVYGYLLQDATGMVSRNGAHKLFTGMVYGNG